MLRGLSIVVVVLTLFSAGFGQEVGSSDSPVSKENIQRLFIAMHLHERMKLLIEQARMQEKPMIADLLRKEVPEVTPKQLTELQSMADDMIDAVYKNYPIDKILEDIVPVYQRHLTKADCEGLITFYSSPVGQKVLRELPSIQAESMQVTNSRLQPDLEAAINKIKQRATQIIEEDQKSSGEPAGRSK